MRPYSNMIIPPQSPLPAMKIRYAPKKVSETKVSRNRGRPNTQQHQTTTMIHDTFHIIDAVHKLRKTETNRYSKEHYQNILFDQQRILTKLSKNTGSPKWQDLLRIGWKRCSSSFGHISKSIVCCPRGHKRTTHSNVHEPWLAFKQARCENTKNMRGGEHFSATAHKQWCPAAKKRRSCHLLLAMILHGTRLLPRNFLHCLQQAGFSQWLK